VTRFAAPLSLFDPKKSLFDPAIRLNPVTRGRRAVKCLGGVGSGSFSLERVDRRPRGLCDAGDERKDTSSLRGAKTRSVLTINTRTFGSVRSSQDQSGAVRISRLRLAAR